MVDPLHAGCYAPARGVGGGARAQRIPMGISYDALAELVVERATTRPFLVGVAGSVSVGKTTMVQTIAARLVARGCSVQVLSTDSFLLPNRVLNARGLLMRKGFPESYDHDAIDAALTQIRSGAPALVPVYAHDVYDIVSDRQQRIEPADIVLVEGIVALQEPIAGRLDLAIYIEAAEEYIRDWYVRRFLELAQAGATDTSSYYHRFAGVPPQQLRQLATNTWDSINGPNLHDHIAPSATRADIVVVKAADHSITALHALR